MRTRSTILTTAALAAALLLTGCATSRSELRIESPQPLTTAASPNAPVVRIRSITDARVFEQKPADPSTPSLGFGGATTAADEVKARAIGRKRNTYGKALGDVLLEPAQTVIGLLQDSLSAGLQEAGYRVVNGESSDGIPLDVRITRFWSWFQPGFWSIKLHSQIATELQFDGEPAFTVQVHATDSRQAATEKAWMEIVQKGLAEYRSQVFRQPLPVGSGVVAGGAVGGGSK